MRSDPLAPRSGIPSGERQTTQRGRPPDHPLVLLGCASHEQLERIAARVRRAEPDHQIWLVSLPGAAHLPVDRTIPYRDHGGVMANGRARVRLVQELRAAAPHRVILPATGERRLTISNLASLAWFLGAPVRVYDSAGHELDIAWANSGRIARYLGLRAFAQARSRLSRRGAIVSAATGVARASWLPLAYAVSMPLRLGAAGFKAARLGLRWQRRS